MIKKIYLILATLIIGVLLVMGIYWQKHRKEVARFSSKSGQVTEFKVRSELAGYELVSESLNKKMWTEYENLTGFSDNKGVYNLRILGNEMKFVQPAGVEFVFSDMNNLTKEEQDRLIDKVTGEKGTIVRGYRNIYSLEGVMSFYIYYDVDHLATRDSSEMGYIWSYNVMNLVYVSYYPYPMGDDKEAARSDVISQMAQKMYEGKAALVRLKNKAGMSGILDRLGITAWWEDFWDIRVMAASCMGQWVCEAESWTNCHCPDNTSCGYNDSCLYNGGGKCICTEVCGGASKTTPCHNVAYDVCYGNHTCGDGYCNPPAQDSCTWVGDPPAPPPECGALPLTFTAKDTNVGATSLSRATADTRKGFRAYDLFSKENTDKRNGR